MAKNQYKINYTATPTLSRFHESDVFIRGAMGCYGSGKSVAMCMEIMSRAQRMPRSKTNGKRISRWAVIRSSYRELLDSTVKTWFEWFPEEHFGVFKKTEMTHFIRVNDLEMDVMFRALDTADDVGKLLSVEYTGGWINEAREIPRAILDALAGRVGRYPRQGDTEGPYWSGIIMDTNPPDTDHWWYKLAEEPQRFVDPTLPTTEEQQLEQFHKTYRFWKQPGGLAPDAENRENLHPQYYERLAIGKSPEWCKVYIHGQYGFVTDGRPVFPEYVDQVHCSDRIVVTRGIPLMVGLDFGLTPAAVFLQVTPRGQVLIIDELTSESMGIERFADILRKHIAEKYAGLEVKYFGDPAGNQRAQTDEKTCFQILAAKGMEVEPGKQDLTIRLESMRKALNSMVDGRPGLQIHPRCRMLHKGFLGMYCYKRMRITGTERFQDAPDKNAASHAMDAAMYPLTKITGLGLIDPSFNYYENEDDAPRGRNSAAEGRSAITGY